MGRIAQVAAVPESPVVDGGVKKPAAKRRQSSAAWQKRHAAREIKEAAAKLELPLRRATMYRIVHELLPEDMRIKKGALDAIREAATDYIAELMADGNDIAHAQGIITVGRYQLRHAWRILKRHQAADDLMPPLPPKDKVKKVPAGATPPPPVMEANEFYAM